MRTGFLAGLLLGWAVAKQLRRKRYSVVREEWDWSDVLPAMRTGRVA